MCSKGSKVIDKQLLTKQIELFNLRNNDVVISYGGDGTLLRTFHINSKKKHIIPIRNYGLCEKHKNVLMNFLQYNSLKYFNTYRCDLIEHDNKCALSEIQIINSDPTCCMRFDVHINNKIYMENVIANGFILSTKLGATGYFKSVTRTIFREGFGLGFICPTYGINNIVLKNTDIVEVIFKRSSEIYKCFDYEKFSNIVEPGDNMIFKLSNDTINLYGYDIFMCPDCRKHRNSTIVNDQYIV